MTDEAERVPVPITLSCCPHLLAIVGIEMDEIREVAVNFDRRPGGNGDTWHFQQARVALSYDRCDCPGTAAEAADAFQAMKRSHDIPG